ncbi:MAG TPA: glycosyltransferase N-terminal domain-containing protein [Flavisolibacter sp.]|nr:glycosyltransferase N-terminal domain-containing protein [Flavisolibacter sp.]
MLSFYNLFIRLYSFAIGHAAAWNKKAKAWRDGRKDVFTQLQNSISPSDQVIWVHCSSAGEFEQGKPVIEALKKTYPGKKILVTFFSPSGYNVAGNYAFADAISYLPLDTRKNAEQFFKIAHPELVIFVKYEFWYHHLSVAAFHHVPILLISATFRKEQVFFRSYGGFFRQMLHLFRHLFVQDQASIDLLQSAGIMHCSISGDTRFDRVAAIAEKTSAISYIDSFIGNKQVIVAGSTWEGDDEIVADYAKKELQPKLIIAPHEITAAHIDKLRQLFPNLLLYSHVKEGKLPPSALAGAQVLIIDSVGLLSRLYAYATFTYVGGGFTKDGIHNILEAAVWGKPVIFGPNYRKYREATELIQAGGAYSVATAEAFKRLANDLLFNESHLQACSANARSYIEKNTGATERIMKAIQEKRLLTN